MATRRIITSEKTIFDKDETVGNSPPAGERSDISPAVPRDVIFKLLGFTLAMIAAPIGSYFMTVQHLFAGNSTYAGATAAIVANLVLIAYVIVAMNEDQSEQEERKKSTKKNR